MKFCSECGEKLLENAKFCPECGTPVAQTENRKQKSENTKDDHKTQVRGKTASYGVFNLENLPEGHLIDERYEIKEKVGQGGFGAVYRVFDKKMGIDKALKIIPVAIVNDEEAMADLQTEARTMISLNHNRIVRVYDFHDSGAIKYIDMEFVEGKTLTKFKLEHPNKQVPEAKVKELAVKIADGLAYAHSKGIIHKDIKPQNVMLTGDGDVKIMDFGIAETVRTSMSRIQNTSSSGTFVYMSPEQIKGKDVGKESDIYSFGAMLYELLSGHPPFYKGDINYQILNEEPEPIKNISGEISDLIEKCLEKKYSKRCQNFDEVISQLGGKIQKYEEEIINSKINEQKELEVEKIPGMVFVKGGTFQMGSNDEDYEEKPVHTVTVGENAHSRLQAGFYIGKTEVTQKEWKEVMGSNPSYFKGDNLPVEKVSWYDAVEFCNKKSEKEGLQKCYSGSGKNIKCDFSKNGYRLPTEAEWEYAARGGVKTHGRASQQYAGSNNIRDIAWYDDNSDGKTHSVGEKKPNELGIYDMSGNVWEWCNDWYGKYSSNPQTNPKGASSGSFRMNRGGSWGSVARFCRVADRGLSIPGYGYHSVGFRLLRSSK